MRVTVETQRMILRPFVPEDYEEAFKWCGDPKVNTYMIYPLYTKAEDVRTWLESRNLDDPDNYDLGFELKETGELIGSGGLVYDPEKVSFEKLLNIYFANVDPFDSEGQFIDKGFSYTLAIFYNNDEEKEIAEKKLAEIERNSGKETYVALLPYKNFYEAEEYHQDYYLKNPEAFEKELIESGRKK